MLLTAPVVVDLDLPDSAGPEPVSLYVRTISAETHARWLRSQAPGSLPATSLPGRCQGRMAQESVLVRR